MYSRNVIFKLLPNHLMRFIDAYKRQVLEVLKQQKGFRGEVMIITASGEDVIASSYWERREDADLYEHAAYKRALEALAGMIEEGPAVRNSEVISSTFHNLGVVL
jgi:hypothetical protein